MPFYMVILLKPIFMEQPPGFVYSRKPNHVRRDLNKLPVHGLVNLVQFF